MMELSKKTQLDWRRFLLSDSGKEGMLFLRERSPGISSGESHVIILSAGKVEGYKIALDTISEIIASESKKDLQIENE